MKKLFIIFIFIFGLFLNCQKKQEIKIAKVSFIKGKATVIQTNSAKIKLLKMGDYIFNKDIILTANNSSLSLILSGLTGIIKIKEKSTFIANFKNKKENKFIVKTGKIIFGLKKLQKNSSFDVETPTAVAGVRGTSFMVDVQENGNNAFPYFVKINQKKNITTKVAVLAGAVEFSTPEKTKSVMINSLKEAILQGSDFDNVKIVDIKRLSLEQLNEIKDFAEIKKLKMNEITEEISEVEPEIQKILNVKLKTKSDIRKIKTKVKDINLNDNIKMQKKKIEKIKTATKRDGKYLEDSSAW